jgi:sister-chromatid-cohesion protein PDS5
MIYHLAQRLKAVEDGIDAAKSENLYVMSDIAEAITRHYADVQGWSLQVISIKAGLPSGLFSKLPSHAKAQEIAAKRYIPEDLADRLEDLVKNSVKAKKRKVESSQSHPAKKPRPSTNGTASAKNPKVPKPVKTPKKRRTDSIPSSERRKSSRGAGAKNYAENDDREDEEELERWQDEDGDAEANKENVGSSTPPTSDPTPAPLSAKKLTPKTDKLSPVTKKKTSAVASKAVKHTLPRAGKTTRGKKERDIMDVPSDSD